MKLEVNAAQLNRARYFLSSAVRYAIRGQTACLNCGARNNPVEQRKAVVTQLRRCQRCKLLYRTPTDDPRDNERFYESEYVAELATQMPSTEQLAQLKATSFKGTSKDFSYHVACLRRLGLREPGMRLFDFGCSWGYASYQFTQAGFQVVGYEIAPTRRNYARDQLGVEVVTRFDGLSADDKLRGTFDCFFSSHVLEHVPSPSQVIREARALLKPGGLFVACIPNGSARRRARDREWVKHWGQVHPNFLDEVYLDHEFRDWPRLFTSSNLYHPVIEHDVDFGSAAQRIELDDLTRRELVVAAKKPREPHE